MLKLLYSIEKGNTMCILRVGKNKVNQGLNSYFNIER